MISLEKSDGRRGLGLGFGVGEDMEETELEEGEACCYQHDDDSTIDPDIALSYIDEKLQDVLGHFQKDFEGGVCAENLGPKYGGYGSFLPAHQRSPGWPHPRSPPKGHNHNMPGSSNNFHLEAGCQNPVISSSTSLPVELGPTSVSSASLPVSGTPSAKNIVKQNFCMPSAHRAEESTSKSELADPSHRKTLKFRIKMGSDTLSTRKNAEIYSGLGLDISPSSSLDNSHTDSEGLFHEPQDVLDESPTNILQMMTLFPVHGSLLLSPLPDDLICLTEKEKHHGDFRLESIHKGSEESFMVLINGSASANGVHKVLQDKKPKSFEQDAFSVELKNRKGNDGQNNIGVVQKKVADIDTFTCEELVSNNLKLPLLPDAYCNTTDSLKGTAKAVDESNVVDKGEVEASFCDLAKEESSNPVVIQEVGGIEKPNGSAGSAVNAGETKKTSSQDDDDTICPRKGGNLKGGYLKGGNNDVPAKSDANGSRRKKYLNAELTDCPDREATHKATPLKENGMKLTPAKEQSSSGGKKKSKGSQIHCSQGAEVLKDGLSNDSSATEYRKNSHASRHISKSGAGGFLRHRGTARDRYKDFFGDLEVEEGDNDMVSEEMPSSGRLKDSEVVEKGACEFKITSKERLRAQEIDEPSTSEGYPRMGLNMPALYGNGSISDAAPPTADSETNDNWVCCDKCQKWRLLPLGTNPDSLPEKWICSMLDWLPGMNRCSFSEKETTGALVALCQNPAPASGNQSDEHLVPGGVLSGVSSSAARFDRRHQVHGVDTMPTSGKRKHGSKDLSNVTTQDSSSGVSNSKMILQASVRSGLNGGNRSPANELNFPRFGQSSAVVVEKQRHKQKEKNKLRESCSDGGDSKKSKIRKRKEADQDSTAKKIKRDGTLYTDEGRTSDHGKAVLTDGHGSNNGLSIHASGKDQRKYNDYSMDSKYDVKDNLRLSVRNQENQMQFTSDARLLHTGKCYDKDILKKRKADECEDAKISALSLPSSGHCLQDCKEKKTRVSRSEGKETTVSIGSGGTYERGRSMKDQQLEPELGSTLSKQSLNAVDSLRRDFGSVQHPVAATSSSSKVSGSHKNKVDLQEAKGSPVESVSSSPMRTSNLDRFTSKRSLVGKDYSCDASFFSSASPRKCSDGEDGGSDRSGTARKDETGSAIHCGFLGSSEIDIQERDLGKISGNKDKEKLLPLPEFVTRDVADVDVNTLGQTTQFICKPLLSDHCHDEEREIGKKNHANEPPPRKYGKGSSSRLKDKNRIIKSEMDYDKLKSSDSFNESVDRGSSCEEKSRAGRSTFQEKFRLNSDAIEKNFASKKVSSGKLVCVNGNRGNQSNMGLHDDSDIKGDCVSSQDLKLNLLLDHDDEKSSKRFLSEKTDRMEVSRGGKSHALPPSSRGQNETLTCSSLPNPESQKEKGSNVLSTDAALKTQNQSKKAINQNGNQPVNVRYFTANGNKTRDPNGRSPVRRDSSSQAATNAVKEAKDLKHLADRFKNAGSTLESTGLYFQAALKFLHGASLLESSNSESIKHGEMIQSMQMYSSTAKLCEFCAHEFEKSKDMAAAALAYKCVEVAYMRVIYSSRSTASRDRHELQTALKIVPPGESPSSSASDIDNLNNPATLDKAVLPKDVSSPQIAGNLVITAQNRSSFLRVLNFAQDANFAMEASRKSRMAFAATNSRLEQAQYREGISCVKRALDFTFQDVEELLRLVRFAMEAISR